MTILVIGYANADEIDTIIHKHILWIARVQHCARLMLPIDMLTRYIIRTSAKYHYISNYFKEVRDGSRH